MLPPYTASLQNPIKMGFACDLFNISLTCTIQRGCSCAGATVLGVALVGGFSLLQYVNSHEQVCNESCRGVLKLPVQALM